MKLLTSIVFALSCLVSSGQDNATRSQLNNLQYEIEQLQKALKKAEREQAASEWEAEQRQKARSEKEQIELFISSMEAKHRDGLGLTNDEVQWVKAAGYMGKNQYGSPFATHVNRLYTLYFTEQKRRQQR